MSARTAVGVFCVSALVAGGLAPTAALAKGHDKHSDTLSVSVCKKVKGGDDGDGEFQFKGWTKKEGKKFWLSDDECKQQHFKYDKNVFYLKELNSDGYDVRYNVRGDWKKYSVNDNDRLKVTFEDNGDPYLRIKVVNKEQKDD
jgi:hypothetical protein